MPEINHDTEVRTELTAREDALVQPEEYTHPEWHLGRGPDEDRVPCMKAGHGDSRASYLGNFSDLC